MSDEQPSTPATPSEPAKPKNPGGRPTKLTPELQAELCRRIKLTKIALADAARIVGLDPQTVSNWLNRGKKEKRGKFREFFVAVSAARAEGTEIVLAQLAKAGSMPKHWQAAEARLRMTEPRYAQKLTLELDRQLKGAVERLQRVFADRPAILEEALAAVAGDELEEDDDG